MNRHNVRRRSKKEGLVDHSKQKAGTRPALNNYLILINSAP